MKRADLKGKKITVFGLGLHGGGVDTVRFLVRCGAQVTVTDIKTRETLAPSLERLRSCKGVTYVLGQHRVEDFTRADMVIKTPAVPWNNKHVQMAIDHGVPVYVDISLFFLLYGRDVIGITGTKGKSSTSQFIVQLLRAASLDPQPVGVSQHPVLGALSKLSARGTVAVCELSSWRCAALHRIARSPRIAVVTNILPDHRDYYKTLEEYARDKYAITEHQKRGDVLIINADDPVLSRWETQANVIRYSRKHIPDGPAVFIKHDIIYERTEDATIEVCALSDVPLSGAHNHENFLAAVAAVRAFGVRITQIRAALDTIHLPEHRAEVVAQKSGVTYINDTAATIPDAAIATLAAQEGRVVWIGGGSDKGVDYTELALLLAQQVRGIVLFRGTASDKIIAALRHHHRTPDAVVDTMEDAVAAAQSLAHSGDCVVLSPGAASFGLFAHEFDRGEQFRAIVHALPEADVSSDEIYDDCSNKS